MLLGQLSRSGLLLATASVVKMRLERLPLGRLNGIIKGQLVPPNEKGPTSSVSNFQVPCSFRYSIVSFCIVSGSSGGKSSIAPVYSKPRSHNAVPAVAWALTEIVPEFPLETKSDWLWLMVVSNVTDAQSAGAIGIRISSSGLSVPSPLLPVLAAPCQMPPASPLMREYVLVAAPPGKAAFVL